MLHGGTLFRNHPSYIPRILYHNIFTGYVQELDLFILTTMTIRIRLREVAKEKGISQSRLMRKADVDIRTIQRIYRDPYTNITLQTLEKLSIALECDVCDLIVRESR